MNYGIKEKHGIQENQINSVPCGTVGHLTDEVWLHTPHNHLSFS